MSRRAGAQTRASALLVLVGASGVATSCGRLLGLDDLRFDGRRSSSGAGAASFTHGGDGGAVTLPSGGSSGAEGGQAGGSEGGSGGTGGDVNGGEGGEGDAVRIAPGVRQNLGIRTAPVELDSVPAEIRAPGVFQWNLRAQQRVAARVEGLVERVHVRTPFFTAVIGHRAGDVGGEPVLRLTAR